MFTEQKLIPLWRFVAAEITLQLVPDFTADPRTVVDFDTSEVRALADDQNAEAVRLKTLVESGIITTDEARAEIGLEPRPDLPAVPASGQSAVRGRQSGPHGSRVPAARVASMGSQSARLIPLPTADRLLPTRESKAIEDLPAAFDAMRQDDLPDWVAELTTFFAQQRRRVLRRLRSGADTASDLVPEVEVELLSDTLEPLQLDTLDQVVAAVSAELGLAFGLDDAQTRAYLRAAGANIGGITTTTRTAVQDELIAGQQAGEGIPQLAQRLLGLPAFNAARATTVARTELGLSQMQASLSSYRASGVVVGVRILDGDYDEACAARNGTTLSLAAADAGPHLLHPNCVASYAPLTSADDLVRSA
jgi:hypothetical protein